MLGVFEDVTLGETLSYTVKMRKIHDLQGKPRLCRVILQPRGSANPCYCCYNGAMMSAGGVRWHLQNLIPSNPGRWEHNRTQQRVITPMKTGYSIAAILLILILAVSGCGAKGDLYLPEDAAHKQQPEQDKEKKKEKQPSPPATEPLSTESSTIQPLSTEPTDTQ